MSKEFINVKKIDIEINSFYIENNLETFDNYHKYIWLNRSMNVDYYLKNPILVRTGLAVRGYPTPIGKCEIISFGKQKIKVKITFETEINPESLFFYGTGMIKKMLKIFNLIFIREFQLSAICGIDR